MSSLITWCAAFFVSSTALAQGDPAPSVETLLAELEAELAKEVPSDGERASALREALSRLEKAQEARARAAEYIEEAREAPDRVSAIRAELQSAPDEEDAPSEVQTGDELESQLAQEQAGLEAVRNRLSKLEQQTAWLERRKAEVPEEIVAAQGALETARAAQSDPADPSDTSAVVKRTLVEELSASLELLTAERETLQARRELVVAERDLALRNLARSEERVSNLQGHLGARRALEAEAAAREAQSQLERVTRRFPVLGGVARETQELAELRTGPSGLPARIVRASTDLEVTRRKIDELRNRHRSAVRRVSAGGLTEGMGLILRRDFEWLPKPSSLRGASTLLEKSISKAELELIAIEEQRDAIVDLDRAAEEIVGRFDQPLEQGIKRTVRQLLEAKRQAQDAARDDLLALRAVLYDHRELAAVLTREVEVYRAFIEKRILWVRSAPSNPSLAIAPAIAEFGVLQDSLFDASLRSALERCIIDRWAGLLFLASVSVALLGLRARLKKRRAEAAVQVRSFRTDRYSATIRELLHTSLLALPLPLLAWSVGWLVTSSGNGLLDGVAYALRTISFIWFFYRFLWAVAARQGIGVAHFRWPLNRLSALRRELRWFEPTAIGLGSCALALGPPAVQEYESLSRLFFIAAMLSLALFLHRVVRKKSQFWGHAPEGGKGLLGKTHGVWSWLVPLVPFTLALLALIGFHYTAIQLELRLRYSIAFAALLVIVNALLLRWLHMTRRALAVKKAIEAKERLEQEAEEGGAVDPSGASLDADQIDIPAVDAQTRKLFGASMTLASVVGLYLIWASVLPALQGLDRVQLYPSFIVLPEEHEALAPPQGAGPGTSIRQNPTDSEEETSARMPMTAAMAPPESADAGFGLPTQLTLADTLIALILVLLTVVAARNLPALLELAVLQRLPLEGGARYAIATISRYLIVVAGIGSVSSALGIGWQHVQWLAAALTFGLAFGLQEIFANFVSGLIILIERPVRVGDVVTVGETEGRITQLRMRATTVLDWDRREYLIPNKEFITGSVINWTLSDPVTRVVIPVGIAYGSDTVNARKLLLQVAHANPLVLRDPAPSALFRSFGASSLDFELRVFIANRDLWPELIDGLHSQIDNAFRRAEIEIAFPQRDLHIRTVEGLKGKHLLEPES